MLMSEMTSPRLFLPELTLTIPSPIRYTRRIVIIIMTRSPVIVVPILDDNFCYFIEYEPNMLALVDPADPPCVQAALEELLTPGGKVVTHIFATHHHWDHSGGNDAMVYWLKGKGQEGVVVVGGGEP